MRKPYIQHNSPGSAKPSSPNPDEDLRPLPRIRLFAGHHRSGCATGPPFLFPQARCTFPIDVCEAKHQLDNPFRLDKRPVRASPQPYWVASEKSLNAMHWLFHGCTGSLHDS